MILNIIAQNWKEFLASLDTHKFSSGQKRIIEVAFYGGHAYLIDYLKQVIIQNPNITLNDIKALLHVADKEARLFFTVPKT